MIELNTEAEILEVGGGILALAIQLASDGFKITTVEPVSEGFDDISWIMGKFSQIAQEEGVDFFLIRDCIENLTFDTKFEFVFSINVMEHLEDPYAVITQLSNSLTHLVNIGSSAPIMIFHMNHILQNGFGLDKTVVSISGLRKCLIHKIFIRP